MNEPVKYNIKSFFRKCKTRNDSKSIYCYQCGKLFQYTYSSCERCGQPVLGTVLNTS